MGKMNKKELHQFLEKTAKKHNNPAFIKDDPIIVPHSLSKKQDIEIIGFWIAMLAWGNRTSIINSGKKLLALMDNAPHQFILQHEEKDLQRFENFKHRTFNYTDTLYFIEFFKQHYAKYESLESAFLHGFSAKEATTEKALINFYDYFFSLEDAPNRTRKHISSPLKNSACKRVNMALRWFVRTDKNRVDFGIWKNIKPSQLLIPLDVHVERNARMLGLLSREKTNWKAVLELTEALREFDAEDPVKYDFALFGMGVNP